MAVIDGGGSKRLQVKVSGEDRKENYNVTFFFTWWLLQLPSADRNFEWKQRSEQSASLRRASQPERFPVACDLYTDSMVHHSNFSSFRQNSNPCTGSLILGSLVLGFSVLGLRILSPRIEDPQSWDYGSLVLGLRILSPRIEDP